VPPSPRPCLTLAGLKPPPSRRDLGRVGVRARSQPCAYTARERAFLIRSCTAERLRLSSTPRSHPAIPQTTPAWFLELFLSDFCKGAWCYAPVCYPDPLLQPAPSVVDSRPFLFFFLTLDMGHPPRQGNDREMNLDCAGPDTIRGPAMGGEGAQRMQHPEPSAENTGS